MVARPALRPFLNVSVTTKMIIGPGMEATENPMAKARGKVTKGNLEPFLSSVNRLRRFASLLGLALTSFLGERAFGCGRGFD